MRFVIINLTNTVIPITRTNMQKANLIPHKPFLLETMHTPEIKFWQSCTDPRFRILSDSTEIDRYLKVVANQAKNNTANIENVTPTQKDVTPQPEPEQNTTEPQPVTEIPNNVVVNEVKEEVVDEETKTYTGEQLTEMKVAELKRYINTSSLMTVAYTGNAINLTGQNVYSVICVMRSQPTYGTFMQDADVFTMASSYYNMNNIEDYTNRMTILQQRNTISTDLDFIWENETKTLYISTNPPFPPALTIQYVKDYKDVSEVTDPYWIDLILRLSTAYTKQALGRARGKYKLNSSQYELDGDTLIAEANQEIVDLRQYLQANHDNIYVID